MYDKKIKLICFVVISECPNAMELMMFIGNDLIESVPLEERNISKPGYLGAFKRTLKRKHSELIQQCTQPPEFLVMNLLVSTAKQEIK